jgi:glycosyltransferase involved in cell wall biosynthesis
MAANLEKENIVKDGLLEKEIKEKDGLISQYERSIKEVRDRNSQIEGFVLEKNNYISQLENAIYLMRNTLGWKVLEKGRNFRERLLPRGKRRRKIYDVAVKSFRVINEQGVNVFIRKARRKLRSHEEHVHTTIADVQSKRDVLIISGCPGDAFRYRCIHQLEQLQKQGFVGSVGYFDQLDLLSSIPLYYFFILHRVPINDHVATFIDKAKSQKKIVIFDTDDLIFDESYGAHVHALNDMSPSERAVYYDGLRRYGMTLRLCEYAITTTEYLADEIKKTGRTVFINRNAVSDEMVALSENAVANRAPRKGEQVIIGYFSGTPTHDADFARASGALVKILEKYECVRLLVVGHLKLPDVLNKYENRVFRKPLVPWRELPALKACADINIAPLEHNPFCESKSELKFIEAALVGVPTVASNVGGFKVAIKSGINGFLAESETEWIEALSFLIENTEKRIEIGECAKKYVLDNYTTGSMGKNFKQVLNSIRRSRIDPDSLDIGWVLQAPFKGSGGYTTIFRMISSLRQFGHESTVYIDPMAHLSGKTDDEVKNYIQGYFGNDFKIVVGHDHIGTHDVLIATAWPTALTVVNSKWSFKKAYFVQDHEPDFYTQRDSNYALSENTYKLGLPCLTIGPYLSHLLETRYGTRTGFFDFSIDEKIYFPVSLMPEKKNQARKILFYARPETRRRGFDMGIKALQKVYERYPEIEILLYGSDSLAQHKVPFPYKNLGVVAPAELGARYREADIGLSISLTNLSLVPLEMMACGCVVVEIDSPRCEGTLINRENSLLADPTADGIADAICELLGNDALYEKLCVNGVSFAAQRTHERAARQFEELLFKEIDSAVVE